MKRLQSRGMIQVGTTSHNKCDNDDQCDKTYVIDPKDPRGPGVREGVKCQKAKGPYGEFDLPGKYCCVSTGPYYCEDSRKAGSSYFFSRA